jgi:hypothetical protein
MNKTKPVETSIQAVSPDSILGAADESVGAGAFSEAVGGSAARRPVVFKERIIKAARTDVRCFNAGSPSRDGVRATQVTRGKIIRGRALPFAMMMPSCVKDDF